MMHPGLQGKGAQVEPPRKHLHPHQLSQNHLEVTPEPHTHMVAGGISSTLQPRFRLPLPCRLSSQCRALAGAGCWPGSASLWPPLFALAGTWRVPWAVRAGCPGLCAALGQGCASLPGQVSLPPPFRHFEGCLCQHCVPKINHLGVALVMWTCRLTSKASPQMPKNTRS